MAFYKTMFGLTQALPTEYTLGVLLDNRVLCILILALVGSTPIVKNLLFPSPSYDRSGDRSDVAVNSATNSQTLRPASTAAMLIGKAVLRTAWVGLILSLSICEMAAGTYNPFIYFRF
jgi:hypothetical protein